LNKHISVFESNSYLSKSFFFNKRYYSVKSNLNIKSKTIPVSVPVPGPGPGPGPVPVPILILKNLQDKNIVKSYKLVLNKKGGIYSFFNTINGKQYIGCAKGFYIRLCEHINKNKSNYFLQKAFIEYGLNNFNFYVYEYFTFQSKKLSSKALIDLEKNYISKFDFNSLYNLKSIGASILRYKHTEEAKQKKIDYWKDKTNLPTFTKKHKTKTFALINKSSILNPMNVKNQSEDTKKKIDKARSKYPLGVGIFDLENNLIFKFSNNTELAKHLNISKVTVGKYLNKRLIYKNIYLFKPIEN
jgi:group I intron endonuclease